VKHAIHRITSDALNIGFDGYGFIDRVIDKFAARERIRVIVSSPDYQEFTLLWGGVSWTKGSRREILIEGGPRSCQAALRDLEANAKGVEVITAHLQPPIPWHRRLFGTH
jgi:hypothetical protein